MDSATLSEAAGLGSVPRPGSVSVDIDSACVPLEIKTEAVHPSARRAAPNDGGSRKDQMCFPQRNDHRTRLSAWWASVGQVDIDNSCGYFTAELGKKKKVLGLNLDAVDRDFSAQKRVSGEKVHGVARRQARRGRAGCKVVLAEFGHITCLTAFYVGRLTLTMLSGLMDCDSHDQEVRIV